MSKLYITWEQFQQDTEKLVGLIKEKYNVENFIGIVAIARGGYIPATIVAHRLNTSTYDHFMRA